MIHNGAKLLGSTGVAVGANSDLNICAMEVLATHRLLRKHFLCRQYPSSLVGDGWHRWARLDKWEVPKKEVELRCTSLLSLL